MLSISSDVPIGVLFAGGGYDVLGAKHIKANGASDKSGVIPEVFELGGQGTLRIYNPYGTIGAITYAKPQLILGNVGYDCNNPAWTYSSINQNASGEFTIGTLIPSQPMKDGKLQLPKRRSRLDQLWICLQGQDRRLQA